MTLASFRVLIVEDDPSLSHVMETLLTTHGYRVDTVGTVAQARIALGNRRPDLVLLDLGLPDGDGLAVLAACRELSTIPVIVVSARGAEAERVRALDDGADDYVVKPFTVPEFLARIRASLRRAAHYGQRTHVLRIGSAQVDLEARLASKDGEPLHLTAIEYRLLEALARRQGRPVSSRQLIQEVWGAQHSGDTQGLRTYVRALRQKIEVEPSAPIALKTEIGIGYRLVIAE